MNLFSAVLFGFLLGVMFADWTRPGADPIYTRAQEPPPPITVPAPAVDHWNVYRCIREGCNGIRM